MRRTPKVKSDSAGGEMTKAELLKFALGVANGLRDDYAQRNQGKKASIIDTAWAMTARCIGSSAAYFIFVVVLPVVLVGLGFVCLSGLGTWVSQLLMK